MTVRRARGGGAGVLHHRIRASAGMVTAEFAVALLAVVPVAASIIMLAGLAAVQVEVVEAARQAARSVARGDPEAAVRADLARILPEASLATSTEGALVTVTVTEPVGGWSLVPRFSLSASVTAAIEDGLHHAP